MGKKKVQPNGRRKEGCLKNQKENFEATSARIRAKSHNVHTQCNRMIKNASKTKQIKSTITLTGKVP